MTTCIFTGPTLSAEDAADTFDAIYLPPVKQGDVYRVASRQKPRVIGIIDGYFQQVPSVWHKEILWAMEQGVHLFGSASMGALRAAELDSFGMQGIGKVFQAYRDGMLGPYEDELFEDDDEVAVIHGPAELGYMAVSEAMVNIRYTLAAAARAGTISTDTRDALVRVGKAMFYPERSYDTLLNRAEEEGLCKGEIEALRDWLPEGRINQKRDDALEMLTTLRNMVEDDLEPKRVNYSFERTDLWERAVAASDSDDRGGGEHAESPVLDELRLEGETFAQAKKAAMLRMLAVAECERRSLDITHSDLQLTTDGFRRKVGMFARKDIDCWLKDNQMDIEGFERLMKDEARLHKLESLLAPQLEQQILDHLRASGDYVRLSNRAREKQQALASETHRNQQLDELTAIRLTAWFFEQRLGHGIPANLDGYAASLGFASTQAFYRTLLAEYAFVSAPSSGLNSLGR